MSEAAADMLTPREREVAALAGQGWSVKRIALELGCADKTIYQHITNIAEKIGGHSKPYIRVLLWAQRNLPA